MIVLAIVLGVTLVNNVVTGQSLDRRPTEFRCILRGCFAENRNCEREPNHICCSICPHERRCYYKGKWYSSGRSFNDSCNVCGCFNGLVRCTMRACLPDIGCTHKGTSYTHGSEFKDDCNTCTCDQGTVSCTEIACGKGCYHGGKFYKDGENFKADCNTCRCRNGMSLCTKMACPRPPICLYNGKEYKDKESMPSKRCSDCFCNKGRRICSPRMCPACVGITRPGQCCPDCSGIELPM